MEAEPACFSFAGCTSMLLARLAVLNLAALPIEAFIGSSALTGGAADIVATATAAEILPIVLGVEIPAFTFGLGLIWAGGTGHGC